jgi:amidase
MATSACSHALVHSIPNEDATVIAKLRSAGAIILGKTTMTQMGGMKCSTMPLGFSARGGQGSSAYVEGGHANGGNPRGSSSGSAIAVSAGWAAASLGTDTTGSLTAPAGRAALYTIRPTMGLVSRAGTIPGCKMLDTVGPMAKCVHDVALLLENMVGPDPKDSSSECISARLHLWLIGEKLPIR